MVIDISKIVNDKLDQLETDGTIQKAIEESLEKSILSAVTSAVTGYLFKFQIEKQIEEAVGGIAGKCGLSSYNGFIAQKAAEIVQNMYTKDISEKVQKSLNDTLIRRYENVKLSEIFDKYRKWVRENTDEGDKYERQHFTCELDESDDGHWKKLICRFADKPLENTALYKERGEIEVRFFVFGDKQKSSISSLWINSRDMKSSIKIGSLTDFEAFLVSLYYNQTEIELDTNDVDEDNYYDIDY